MLDYNSLFKRCLGNHELALRLVGKLHRRLETDLAEIESALHRGDVERLGQLAHRLKGAAGNLSATSLYEAAGKLERIARGGPAEPSWDGEEARLAVAGLIDVRELYPGPRLISANLSGMFFVKTPTKSSS